VGTLIQNMNLIRQLVHLDNTSRSIGNAVVVGADRHQAIMADAAFQLELPIKRHDWKGLQLKLFGREGFSDNALGRAMQADLATVASQSSS
jgi:hypothetical protein